MDHKKAAKWVPALTGSRSPNKGQLPGVMNLCLLAASTVKPAASFQEKGQSVNSKGDGAQKVSRRGFPGVAHHQSRLTAGHLEL
jgi:hypothetical protein